MSFGLKQILTNRTRSGLCGVLTAMTLFSAAPLFADQPIPAGREVNFMNFLLQSKDIDLPEDFVARVDDGNLKVVLSTLGADQRKSVKSRMLVALLDEDGNQDEVMTDASGIAEFKNVKANKLHALLVNDSEFHAAIPVLPVSEDKAERDNIQATDIRLTAIPADRQEILTSLARNVVPSVSPGDLYAANDYRSSGQSLYQVELTGDNKLTGRVLTADKDLSSQLRYANITIYQNKIAVAQTTASGADGSFSISGLKPGNYGLIAGGPSGYSAFAFEVVEPAAAKLPAPNGETKLPVSFNAAIPGSGLVIFMIPPKLMNAVTQRINRSYNSSGSSGSGAFPGSMAGGGPGAGGGLGGASGGAGSSAFGAGGGGMGGGLGGLGGGAGGIGGLGGLSGIAGIAAVAGIAANTDSGTQSTNQPVSPIVP